MKLTRELTRIDLLQKVLADKFISEYFVNADPTILKDIVRNDILSIILEAIPKREHDFIKRRYQESHAIRNILIGLYDELVDGSRQTYPPGTFTGLQGQYNCVILARHVITKKLGWSVHDAIKKISNKILYEHYLRSAKECFANHYELLKEVFPQENVQPYYFSKLKNIWKHSDGTLNSELISQAILELITILTDPKGQYKYKLKQLPRWITYKHFQENILPYENNLSYMLHTCFNDSHIKAICFVFPDLKPHYFSHVPRGYWQDQKNIDAVKKEFVNLLTDSDGGYQFSDEELEKFMTFSLFQKPLMPHRKRLAGFLKQGFGNKAKSVLERR